MSEEKRLKARVQNKRKTEAEWYLDVYDAEGKLREDAFIPLKGELIIFAADWSEDNPTGHKYDRFKFGDEVTNVIDLPFADKDILDKIEEVKENIVIDITDNLPTEDINNKALYRLFTATFIHNRHIVDNSICYCVETLPEIGEPATDGNQSIRAYYNMQDGKVYGYLNAALAGAFDLFAGWYPADMLLAAQGWSYAGVISDINSDPNDSAIRVLLNTSVYVSTTNGWKELTNDELNRRFPEITELGHWVHTVQNREGKEPEYVAYPISYSAKEADEETPLYHIPLRVNGRMQSLHPESDRDVATKSYVDAEIQNKAYGNSKHKYHTTNIHYYTDENNQGNTSIGLHQNAEESEQEHIPLRQKSGLMTANVPENAPDNAVVNKGYIKNELDTRIDNLKEYVDETTIPRMFTMDEANGHNREYYIKNPVLTDEEKFPITEETFYTLPSGRSAIVRAIPAADSGYIYRSDWSYIDANGDPLEPPVPIAWGGALPTPVVTKISNTEISWNPVEGAEKYELIVGIPTKYGSDGSFANSHNRVIAEMSRGRGIYGRYTISPNPFGAKDPDPEDYALNKRMDTIPLRMDDGFLRVPVSTYGTTQPVVGDDNYDENQRAMSKQYIDSGIQNAKDYATNCKIQANDYSDSKLVDAKTYSDNNLAKAKKYTDICNNSNNQYAISTLKQQSNVLQVVGNATDYKANALITNITSMEGTGKYSCFSTDLKCITERTSGVLATLLFGEYVFGLTLRVDNGKLLINQFSNTNEGSAGTGNANICTAPLNEWFNLKVKYYQNAENSRLSLYINEKVVAKDIICYYQVPIPTAEINRVRFRYSNVAVTFQFDNMSLVKSDDENMPYTNKVATFEDGNTISNTSGVNYITHSNSTNSSKLDMISVISEDIRYVPLANEKGELYGEVLSNSNDKVLVNKGYVNSLVGDINSVLEAINTQINTFKGV